MAVVDRLRSAGLRLGGRPRRVLVGSCHPCDHGLLVAARDRLLNALADTEVEVRHRDLYGEGFDPTLSADEHATHLVPGIADELQSHADDLTWCDTLVFVYPTWWSGQPAMLKGWFDRVLACGVAWELPDGANRLRPRLRNVRRIVAVTTHGSPKYVNAVEGEGGKRTLTRALRAMCHPLCRTTWMPLYDVDRSVEAARNDFLDQVQSQIRALAR